MQEKEVIGSLGGMLKQLPQSLRLALQNGDRNQFIQILRKVSEELSPCELDIVTLLDCVSKNHDITESEILLLLAEELELHLVSAIPGAMACINQQLSGTTARFVGTVQEYLESQKQSEELRWQLQNIVRECPNCRKSNAFTLLSCNACSTSLADVEISHTINIFTSFVLGIERGNFPLVISMRYQDESFLLFDDILAMASCHLNCIPGDYYVRDLRVLFEHPKQGLILLNEMKEKIVSCIRQDFWSNQQWRRMYKELELEELLEHIILGLNYPPSQYQLHLHAMIPPFTPDHYSLFLQGKHFIQGRWFPLEFVMLGLEKLVQSSATITNAGQLSIEQLIEKLGSFGIEYSKVYQQCYQRYQASHRILCRWSREHFEALVWQGKTLLSLRTNQQKMLSSEQRKQLKKTDKMALQNWGRPYDKEQPTGSYYRYAKEGSLPIWEKNV